MAFNAPITWTFDQFVDEDDLNEQIRDNMFAILHPYNANTSTVDVQNDVSERSLYTVTVTGGDMGANGLLVTRLDGTLSYNTAGATGRLRVKFGGTTLLDTGAMNSSVVGAMVQSWLLEVRVRNRSSTSAQLVSAQFLISGATASAAVGYGGIRLSNGANSWITGGVMSNSAAIDTTSNQTLDITWQWATASATLDITKLTADTYLSKQ